MRQRKAKDLDKRLARCKGHMVFKGDRSMQKYCDCPEELYVEIGCGKGQFIITKAAANPGSRYLAIEGQETVVLRARVGSGIGILRAGQDCDRTAAEEGAVG